MDFRDNNFLHNLERPPSRNNLSIYTIIQIIIILCFGCFAGYNLYSLLMHFKFSLSNLFEIIINTLLFIGMCCSIYGFLSEKNGPLRGGFLLFYFGCAILLIKIIIDWFRLGFTFSSLLMLIIAWCMMFVISKQLEHI